MPISSTMLPLGSKASPFSLLDTLSGKTLSLENLKSDKATVVMFICNHCPYVKHILTKVVEVAKTYQKKHVNFIAISSNDIQSYPADAPERMREEALQHDFTFPYLFDETQDVAKAYRAACTPDFFVFDKNLQCVYRGRFDEATPGNTNPITGQELTAAIDAVLAGKPVSQQQHPSLGCGIKWKKISTA